MDTEDKTNPFLDEDFNLKLIPEDIMNILKHYNKINYNESFDRRTFTREDMAWFKSTYEFYIDEIFKNFHIAECDQELKENLVNSISIIIVKYFGEQTLQEMPLDSIKIYIIVCILFITIPTLSQPLVMAILSIFSEHLWNPLQKILSNINYLELLLKYHDICYWDYLKHQNIPMQSLKQVTHLEFFLEKLNKKNENNVAKLFLTKVLQQENILWIYFFFLSIILGSKDNITSCVSLSSVKEAMSTIYMQIDTADLEDLSYITNYYIQFTPTLSNLKSIDENQFFLQIDPFEYMFDGDSSKATMPTLSSELNRNMKPVIIDARTEKQRELGYIDITQHLDIDFSQNDCKTIFGKNSFEWIKSNDTCYCILFEDPAVVNYKIFTSFILKVQLNHVCIIRDGFKGLYKCLMQANKLDLLIKHNSDQLTSNFIESTQEKIVKNVECQFTAKINEIHSKCKSFNLTHPKTNCPYLFRVNHDDLTISPIGQQPKSTPSNFTFSYKLVNIIKITKLKSKQNQFKLHFLNNTFHIESNDLVVESLLTSIETCFKKRLNYN